MNGLLPFEWIVAVRFLREGRLQTWFIVGGVAIGVGVIVFMSAMLAGLERNFLKRVLTAQAQIQLLPPEQVARPLRGGDGARVVADPVVQRPAQRLVSIDQWRRIAEILRAMPDIETVSPIVAGSVLATRGEASRSATMTGIDPQTYLRIVRVPDFVVAGEARLTSEDIVVGVELARELGAAVGDRINLRAASGAVRSLRVAGLLDFGNKGANQRTAFVALRTAQSLMGLIGGVTTIDIAVRDAFAAEDVARRIAATHEVRAESWIATNAQFFAAMRAQINTNTLIRVFVALSVAFGIAAVLVVSVIQRSREIGILRATGTRQGQVLRVFLIQGGLLGFAGSLLGAALGSAALVWWHAVARQADDGELFPLVLEARLFAATALLATATGVLAAAAPALRAARLDPVVAIRG
jgi:lipoprotein-releasing system permease protein